MARTGSFLLVLILEGRATAGRLDVLGWLNPAEDKPNYTVLKMVSQQPACISASKVADSRILVFNIPSVDMVPASLMHYYS